MADSIACLLNTNPQDCLLHWHASTTPSWYYPLWFLKMQTHRQMNCKVVTLPLDYTAGSHSFTRGLYRLNASLCWILLTGRPWMEPGFCLVPAHRLLDRKEVRPNTWQLGSFLDKWKAQKEKSFVLVPTFEHNYMMAQCSSLLWSL